jgi:hypothetical protein
MVRIEECAINLRRICLIMGWGINFEQGLTIESYGEGVSYERDPVEGYIRVQLFRVHIIYYGRQYFRYLLANNLAVSSSHGILN